MTDLILRKDVLDKIKKTPDLFAKVFNESCLDATVSYGLQLLNSNDPKLTQAKVLRILINEVGNELGITQENELLTEMEVA